MMPPREVSLCPSCLTSGWGGESFPVGGEMTIVSSFFGCGDGVFVSPSDASVTGGNKGLVTTRGKGVGVLLANFLISFLRPARLDGRSGVGVCLRGTGLAMGNFLTTGGVNKGRSNHGFLFTNVEAPVVFVWPVTFVCVSHDVSSVLIVVLALSNRTAPV